MVERPIIAWLTDFGTANHYVGAMKGVALGIAPEAVLVDITHEVPPQDVGAGAFELACAYGHFPAGTIFVCVVDPGVGSSRRAVGIRAGAFTFVAPDNGLLTWVLRREPLIAAVELTAPRYMREPVSATFEGRDRFAPAAAWLARGTSLDAFGNAVAGLIELPCPEATVSGDEVHGTLVRIDRFGNAITNVRAECLGDAPIEVMVGGRPLGLVRAYADGRPGSPCALVGSSGYLEIAVPHGNAAAVLGLEPGDPVRVRPAVSGTMRRLP